MLQTVSKFCLFFKHIDSAELKYYNVIKIRNL